MSTRSETWQIRVRVQAPAGGSHLWSSHPARAAAHPGPRLVLIVIGATVIVALVSAKWAALFLVGVLACLLTTILAGMLVHGDVDPLVIGWVFVFPAGYYFLTLPMDKPVFTLDRFIVLVALAGIVLGKEANRTGVPKPVSTAAWWWMAFLAAAMASEWYVSNPLGGVKFVIETFALPGVLGWYVISRLQVREHLSAIHIATCLMAIWVFAVGLAELLTGTDLMPLPSSLFYSESQTGGWARVNGPFSTNNSFGLIGLATLILLLFLQEAIGKQFRTWQRVLHAAGFLCALAIAVLPMFRSIIATLILVLILEAYRNKKVGVRTAAVAVILTVASLVVWLKVVAPEYYTYRVSDLSNLYGRIAQQKQTWELFSRNPWNGVGVGNFMQAIEGIPHTSFENIESLDASHNNLGEVLAESGILGVVPFVLSQVMWLMAFRSLKKRGDPSAEAASHYFLYLFLAYWVSGMTLSSGYYPDVNIWYMFTSCVLYKYAITADNRPGFRRRTAYRPAILTDLL